MGLRREIGSEGTRQREEQLVTGRSAESHGEYEPHELQHRGPGSALKGHLHAFLILEERCDILGHFAALLSLL